MPSEQLFSKTRLSLIAALATMVAWGVNNAFV